MTVLREYLRRLWGALRRNPADHDLERELRFHLEHAEEELRGKGHAPAEAARLARVRLGGFPQTMEALRDQRGLPWLETLWRDVRYALRMLGRSKEWSAAAILLLALGIGSSAALFSVFQNYALERLPVHKPEELVTMRWSGEQNVLSASYRHAYIEGMDGWRGGHTFPFGFVEQLRDAGRTLSDVIAFAPTGSMNAYANGRAEFVSGQFVSGNFYSSLRVEAVDGRTIMPYDDAESADPVVVISQQYQARRFGMDKSVVGETLRINGMPFTVVGVSPADFRDLMLRGLPDSPDLTIPLAIEPRLRGSGSRLRSPATWWLTVMGRMKPGIRVEAVETELGRVLQQAARASAEAVMGEWPSSLQLPRLQVVPGGHGVSDASREVVNRLAILACMLGSILLIVCVNVASLLFSRGTARQREIAMRAALGASRSRLVVQLLTESVVLASTGGAVGLVAAIWSAPWVSRVALPSLPADITIVSAPVLLFAAALTVAAAVLFGVAPAIRATRPAAAPLAKQGPGTLSSPRTWLGRSLISAQVAVTVFLLVGAGLFLRTLSNLQKTDLGFNPDNVLVFTLEPTLSGYDGGQATSLYRDLEDRLLTIPGIRSVSSSAGGTLLDGGGVRIWIELENRTDRPEVNRFSVDLDFLDTLQIPLELGRTFSADDTPASQPVALVNRAFAREFFPDGSPIGRRFRGGRNEVEVVGVVGDAKVNSLRVAAPPTFYVPETQLSLSGRSVLIRTAGSPQAAVPAIEAAVRGLDSQLPLGDISTLTERIGANHLGSERVMAVTSSAFGGMGFVTAMVGLFGLMSYSVVRRTKEIGVRMALGAAGSDVLRSVMGEIMVVVGLGVLVGLGAALALSRFVESQLFGLSGHDPTTILWVVTMTIGASVLAGYFPARRAARVDPVMAIRCD